MNKFIIFAHARSGSTTLARALKLHPNVTLLEEPFSFNRHQWPGKHIAYRQALTDKVDSLDKQLDLIFEEVIGFKHLQCQLSEEFNKHLLSNSGNIIFLHRRNLLKAAISNQIAEQSRHWGQDRSIVLNTKFKPFSINKLENFISSRETWIKTYKEFIESNNIPHIEVNYENIFGDNIDLRRRLSELENVAAFLGISLKHVKRKPLNALLEPKTKLNNDSTYALIPNLEEINKIFESRYGYLG